jgi:hypothetical protein
MRRINEPGLDNCYLSEHADLLICSYHRFTGKNLVNQKQSNENIYRALFEAPYGVVSHNTEDDPIFNYGNKIALRVFDMDWSEFTNLPSRKSAEPVNRVERERLLARVKKTGFYRRLPWSKNIVNWQAFPDRRSDCLGHCRRKRPVLGSGCCVPQMVGDVMRKRFIAIACSRGWQCPAADTRR